MAPRYGSVRFLCHTDPKAFMGKRRTPPHHLDTVAARLRGLKMLSPLNEKTPKGEAEGYLTAMLYLAPHTLAGGKTLCPHSTEPCRATCLFWSGRGRTPRVQGARLRRTRLYLDDRDTFFDELIGELVQVQDMADRHGLTMAIRLNGTSDVLWERETLDGRTLFDMFRRATFYDYTRAPLHHRRVPENWRLTWSLADLPSAMALDVLAQGHNVSAVVPPDEKAAAPAWIQLNGAKVHIVDGDAHDLRFLDPVPALVLLRPKSPLHPTDRGMVRHGLIQSLLKYDREKAA